MALNRPPEFRSSNTYKFMASKPIGSEEDFCLSIFLYISMV